MHNSGNSQTGLVSIVLCTYNGSQFISEQLNSVRNQSYSNLEIIISDDASADNTVDILQQHAAEDSRIKIFRNTVNAGYTKNFSLACLLAQGTYIAICDQDDVWHKDKIKRLVEQWVPGVPLMYCDSARFTGEVPWDATENPLYRRFEGTDPRKIAIFNTISGHAMIVTKDFLQKILPFPEKISYDWYAAVVATCHGGVGYIHDTLVYQRVHGDNATVGGMYDHNQKAFRAQFKEMVQAHLTAFSNVQGLPEKHACFFKKLLTLWDEGKRKKFSWSLFFFLVANRKLIFNYKRRKFGLISHIKHSYRLVTN